MIFSIKNLIKKPIVLFTASRYITYFLQFIRGILVAKFLGPYFFGIWGFISLVLQYISYLSFGIQYSLNIELSLQKKDKERVAKLNGNGIIISSFWCSLVIILSILVKFSGIDIFKSYSFSQFIILVCILAGINQFIQIFANIYRSYGYLFRIVFGEFLISSLTLLCVFIFKKDELIYALLISMILGGIISVVVYIIKFPFPIKINIDFIVIRLLILSGLSLLVYNVSFYLIMVSARTIISIFYSVEEMGYYSLANNITSASFLGLGAISWVLFPRFLWNLRGDIPPEETKRVINKITKIYSSFAYLIVFFAIMLSPILYYFLHEYEPIAPSLNFLLLSQAIISSCIGYSSLALARKKQVKVAKISVAAVILVILLGLGVVYFKLGFTMIALTVTFGMMYYSILQTRFSEKLIGDYKNIFKSIKKIFPIHLLIPIAIIIIGNLLGYYLVAGVVGFIAYMIFNYKNLIESIYQIKILRPKSIDDVSYSLNEGKSII